MGGHRLDLEEAIYDVFISYSSKNAAEAQAVCKRLEAEGIRCWIAPRDIVPGAEWMEAIIGGIEKCRVMVLIFSDHANNSPQVRREVERALSKGLALIPFRIQNTTPSGAMEFCLSNTHWLDAFFPPPQKHLDQLLKVVRNIVVDDSEGDDELQRPSSLRDAPAPLRNQRPADASRPSPARYAIGVIIVLVLFGMIGAHWYMQKAHPPLAPRVETAATRPSPAETAHPATAPSKTPLLQTAPPVPVAAPVLEAIFPLSPQRAASVQSDYAIFKKLPPIKEIDFGGGVSMRMSLIPPGKFTMGDSTDDGHFADAQPHSVRMSGGFYMGTGHVTIAQYKIFVKDNPDYPDGGPGDMWHGDTWNTVPQVSWREPGFAQSEDHPVVEVSWDDAAAFCQWLSKKTHLRFRLPTEAEWEYCCRAGAESIYPWGENPSDGKGWANCADVALKQRYPRWPAFDWSDGYIFTSPAGAFKANAWGLHDMIGNAFQWCADKYGPYEGDAVDPKGVAASTTYVLRGGSWYTAGSSCHCGFRSRRTPASRNGGIGFRIVQSD